MTYKYARSTEWPATGKFEYHHDYALHDNLHRVIVYLWYLNGGETEIYSNIFRLGCSSPPVLAKYTKGSLSPQLVQKGGFSLHLFADYTVFTAV